MRGSHGRRAIRLCDRLDSHAPAGSAEEVDLASLPHIIALFNERAQGPDAPKTRFSGRQAWAEWLRLLHAGFGCDNNMLIHLRYNRRSAVAYLREMATRHGGTIATHLSAAADLYQRILDDLMKQGLPYNLVKIGETKRAVRVGYTAMVERVSRLEAAAITELGAAAASLAKKPDLRGNGHAQDSFSLSVQAAAQLLGREVKGEIIAFTGAEGVRPAGRRRRGQGSAHSGTAIRVRGRTYTLPA